MPLSEQMPREAVQILNRLRKREPRVHCITNFAAMTLTANMLLCLGAVPSLSYAPEEAADFTARADALLINIGTLDEPRKQAIPLSLETAISRKIPWVLDPVFVNRSEARKNYAIQLAEHQPDLIRGNLNELLVMIGDDPSTDAMIDYALTRRGVVAATGMIDLVTDGVNLLEIQNGHELMTKVTAMGCAGTAVMAAALTVEADPLVATGAALLWLGIAGELAARVAKGPGSFQPAFLDALYSLDEATIMTHAKIS
jgi:hydroxyethylthiazole kinase